MNLEYKSGRKTQPLSWYHSFKKQAAVTVLSAVCIGMPLTSFSSSPNSTATVVAKDWATLDARETPQWWTDAKFGIFIHWGLYSVPSYTSPGQYAEWYWETVFKADEGARGDLSDVRKDARAFHDKNFGKDFSYFDFAPLFKTEMFDADRWAKVIDDSGAKYVVLTSKHHEGYTLWPNEQANKTWGRKWNSVDIGPKRDLVGELSTAVKSKGLKMGLYYSMYEWHNPLYKSDFPRFVDEHYIPQFKDLVTEYEPEVLFMDGEWKHSAEDWKSREVLTWLYNETKVKETVVVNDRWGKKTRHKHGGYYTTEYGAGLPDSDHPWEESRGLGYSYGFNRAENIDHYSSGQQLVLTLADTVSRGGNLLLNIGPTADGRIPAIMQDRLAFVGNWLKYNGEAIYGSKMYKNGFQWSEGNETELDTSTNYKAKYDVIKLTINPDPGMAIKELLFTQNGNNLYAMAPNYPQGKLIVKNLSLKAGAKVKLLGLEDTPISWKNVGGNVV
ncbi:alpha-L-fucosidase, partial [Paraglaciecola sp.]|uniref:alpha-L-fucosidase n=1 Tax=Paraglaciecola sp. TaxID=1920173 RepID=UPI003EF86656